MDDEFPETLNMTEKQIAETKQLASIVFNVTATTVKPVEIQGCFSRTFDVALEDGRTAIIQLRLEPLDTSPFETARRLLRDAAPVINAIEAPHLTTQEHKVWPFLMTKIPGSTWVAQEESWQAEQQVRCMKSLGRLYAKCFLPGRSQEVVAKVIDDLNKIRAFEHDGIPPLYGLIDGLITKAQLELPLLPLFFTHADLNGMNILTDPDGEITGIVDWELASAQPFGIGCGYIHLLAGEIINKQWRQKAAYDDMEAGFWDSLFGSVSPDKREQLTCNLEAVQTSVMIGTLFRVFTVERDEIFVNERLLKSLPTLMKYRIPALRSRSSAAYSGTTSIVEP